jgi:hypothetical protein
MEGTSPNLSAEKKLLTVKEHSALNRCASILFYLSEQHLLNSRNSSNQWLFLDHEASAS